MKTLFEKAKKIIKKKSNGKKNLSVDRDAKKMRTLMAHLQLHVNLGAQ